MSRTDNNKRGYINTFMRDTARGTFEERYQTLASIRQSYIDRAEQCSAYTDPYLFPREGEEGQKLTTPYQSVGAEGVTKLGSKILAVLLPPNRPPFRLRVQRGAVTMEQKKQLQEIEAGLSRIEREITAHIETLNDRAVLDEAIQHLIVTGNCLLHVTRTGLRLFTLRNYVVSRSPSGEPVEIIVREMLDPRVLPPEIREVVFPNQVDDNEMLKPHDRAEYVKLYTQIKAVKSGYDIRQEVNGKLVGKRGHVTKDKCPWLALRMYRVAGEDYGRGYTEKYLGDHKSLEALMKAIVEGSAAAAKVLFLVNPNGTTKAKDIQNAPNLGIINGNAQEITLLHLDKAADFQVAKAAIDTLQQRLSRAYLLSSAVQRQAERVTAEEIRYMAQELESTLGGMYSVLATEFQRPYVVVRMDYMIREGIMPDLGDGVELEIVTGVDALGRGQDTSRLTEWATTVFKTLPQQQALAYLNVPAYMKALAASMGIDDTSLMKDEQTVQQQMQSQQQNQLMQQVAPNAVNQLGQLLGKSMEQQATA